MHKGAVTAVSPVLTTMMNNGMKESTDQVAILEHVEPDTFKQFAAFAYTGVYRLTPKANRIDVCFCVNCGTFACDRDGPRFPFCSSQCQEKEQRRTRGLQYCIDCGKYHAGTRFTCEECLKQQKEEKDRLQIQTQSISLATSPALEDQFKALEYPVAGLSHKAYRKNLKLALPHLAASDFVSQHAKLYIFADTYGMEGLKHLCLHLLHRDLYELELNGRNIDEVVELLRYTYKHTVQAGDEMYGV